MASKALLVLGFLMAALLLISSEVAARELAEETHVKDQSLNKEGVEEAKYGGGYGGNPGGGYGGNHGGGYGGNHGGGYGGNPGGGYGGNHGGGYGGNPGGGYGGNPGGGYGGGGHGGYPGGGHGGGCQYGCCGRGYGYRGGCHCCSFAGQMPDAEFQGEPQN